MCIKNTTESYGIVHKAFHWLMGLVIIGLIIAGLIMVRMDAAPLKFEIYGIHKATGIIILALFALRLLWKWFNPKPAPLDSHEAWEKLLARTIHIALYVLMAAMPLSGWLMSSAAGFPVDLYGLLTLPDLLDKNEDLATLFNQTHEIMGYALIAVIALHVAGAVKHHVIDKDSTLRRMLP